MKQEKNNFIIYKAENIHNGHIYVGTTTKSMGERKKDHEQKASISQGYEFQEAIKTYGPEAFAWSQIDTASSIDELAKKEKQYVIQYDSKENGYNADSGGGIKKTVYQYDMKNGSLLNKYDCLESAANAVNAYKTCIGNACLGQNKTCKGFYWSYNLSVPFDQKRDFRKKQVIQYAQMGKFLAKYSSVAEASRASGIGKTNIAKACRGERNHAGGYRWVYKLIFSVI